MPPIRLPARHITRIQVRSNPTKRLPDPTAGRLDCDTQRGNALANMLREHLRRLAGDAAGKARRHRLQCGQRVVRSFFAAAIEDDWDAAGQSALETINQLAPPGSRQPQERDPPCTSPRVCSCRSLASDMLAVAARAGPDGQSGPGGRHPGTWDADWQIPPEIADEVHREFVERNIDAAKQARKSVRELDELFTTGFRGAEAALVEKMLQKLDQIETDTDDRETALRASLFAIEKDFDPVDAMFLYKRDRVDRRDRRSGGKGRPPTRSPVALH